MAGWARNTGFWQKTGQQLRHPLIRRCGSASPTHPSRIRPCHQNGCCRRRHGLPCVGEYRERQAGGAHRGRRAGRRGKMWTKEWKWPDKPPTVWNRLLTKPVKPCKALKEGVSTMNQTWGGIGTFLGNLTGGERLGYVRQFLLQLGERKRVGLGNARFGGFRLAGVRPFRLVGQDRRPAVGHDAYRQ